VTVLFLIKLPNWSRAVTVMVLALLPVDALIAAGAATTVVCDASTAPGTVKPVKLRADPTPVACAVWVLSVGVIAVPRVRVVDACPAASVADEVGFTEPPPDAAAQVTVTLGTGLPCASVTSTVCGVARAVPT